MADSSIQDDPTARQQPDHDRVPDILGHWTVLDGIINSNSDFDAAAFCGEIVDYRLATVRYLLRLR